MSHDRGCYKCGRDNWDYENCKDERCVKKPIGPDETIRFSANLRTENTAMKEFLATFTGTSAKGYMVPEDISQFMKLNGLVILSKEVYKTLKFAADNNLVIIKKEELDKILELTKGS